MNTTTILTTLSVALFVAGLYIFKKKSSSKFGTGLFLLLTFSYTLLFIVHSVADYFTGNGIDEATIYHIKYGLGGAGFREYSWLIATTISLIMGTMYLLYFISKDTNDPKIPMMKNPSYFLLSCSLFLNPATTDILRLLENNLILFPNRQASANFYDYYRNPSLDLSASSNNHKNLVFIYAESLERTYFDETIFPGLIKELRKFESKNTYFTDIRQVASTHWTTGGMTASQCGIPLFTPNNPNSVAGMDQFLPSAVCLGDLLKDQKYQLSYMGGANLDFAGKGKLLRTHGFTEVLGAYELLPKIEDNGYRTGWGLYDDSLFDLAYGKFVELSKLSRNFGLFLLTLDTHSPNGNPSQSCEGIEYKDGSNKILNAVACSDYIITNFITRITKSPYANDTIIVLASDHLAMKNTAYDLLQKGNRKNLFIIIDPTQNDSNEIKSAGSTLDIGSTLLPFLGYTGEIGFGRNLLSNIEPEEDRIFMHSNFQQWSGEIYSFWDYPTINHTVELNINKQTIRIGERTFRIPVLIELNNKLESILRFDFYGVQGYTKSLVQQLKELNPKKYYMLIDTCENVKEFNKALGEDGFCVLFGQGENHMNTMKVKENTTYTANEIGKLLNLPADDLKVIKADHTVRNM